jgi:hypothetical protein
LDPKENGKKNKERRKRYSLTAPYADAYKDGGKEEDSFLCDFQLERA